MTLPKLAEKPMESAKAKAHTLEELEWVAMVCRDWDDWLVSYSGARCFVGTG